MNTLKLNTISINTIFFFLLKIWISTNIISAFFFLTINDYADGVINYSIILFKKEFWQDVLFIAVIGLIYSIPAIVILGLIIKLWTNNKLILIFVCILLVIVTFYFTGSMALKHPKEYIPPPSFIYSVIISGLILKIKIQEKK